MSHWFQNEIPKQNEKTFHFSNRLSTLITFLRGLYIIAIPSLHNFSSGHLLSPSNFSLLIWSTASRSPDLFGNFETNSFICRSRLKPLPPPPRSVSPDHGHRVFIFSLLSLILYSLFIKII